MVAQNGVEITRVSDEEDGLIRVVSVKVLQQGSKPGLDVAQRFSSQTVPTLVMVIEEFMPVLRSIRFDLMHRVIGKVAEVALAQEVGGSGSESQRGCDDLSSFPGTEEVGIIDSINVV